MSDLAPSILIGAGTVYSVMSVVSLVVYGADKRAAVKGRWRMKERTLHTIDVLGGWPGGLLAQSLFKHKHRKTRFMMVFWASVALHALVWGLAAYLWLAG